MSDKEQKPGETAEDVNKSKQKGYKILSDLKYDGKRIPAGEYNQLSKLKKPEIDKLLAKQYIEK